MKDDWKYEVLHSDPVKRIINLPPPKILRWGTTILLAIFVLMLVFAWIVRYPDVIPSPVEITTENPPVSLKSKISGRISEIYVNDKDTVTANQVVAAMESAASADEIRKLGHAIDIISETEDIASKSFPSFSRLGEIQEFYSSFIKSLSDYNNYVAHDYYGAKINSVIQEISEMTIYLGKLVSKEKLYAENKSLEARKFKRDSVLFVSGVLSESEYERSLQSYLKARIDLKQVQIDHSQKSIELAERNQLLQDYKIKRIDDREKYRSGLNKELLNLKAQIKIWENKYLLISPVDGTISFARYWSANQSVNENEPVVNIIPHYAGDFIGRIKLNMKRSGKVKPGQSVNIKLSGYPYLEYGMVRGVLKSKSPVPENDAYIIEVTFPSGLVTLYGNKLEFNQNMQGIAEIITSDLSLIQKIFNPIHHLMTLKKKKH